MADPRAPQPAPQRQRRRTSQACEGREDERSEAEPIGSSNLPVPNNRLKRLVDNIGGRLIEQNHHNKSNQTQSCSIDHASIAAGQYWPLSGLDR